jgi:hypothetical protein
MAENSFLPKFELANSKYVSDTPRYPL